MLSLFPNQGLHRPTGPQLCLGEAASQSGTMPPSLCVRLPLNFRPVLRGIHFLGQDMMAPSFCIPSWQLCQIFLSPDMLFLSMYKQAEKQICSLLSVLLAGEIDVGALGCVSEV